MNLWLDDLRPAPEGWLRVKTAKEAKRWLMAGAVEKCSLDHDIGACPDCTSRGAHVGDMQTPDTTFHNWCPHVMSGYDLCVWMAATGMWPQEKPQVHSMNPEGARRMRGVIDRYFPKEPEDDDG